MRFIDPSLASRGGGEQARNKKQKGVKIVNLVV